MEAERALTQAHLRFRPGGPVLIIGRMRRIVLNADDLGYDPAVTRGILEGMTRGIVTSTTFMVNTPFSEAAAQQARSLPADRGVGLHLNLARGRPLSSAFASDVLQDGEFVEAWAERLAPHAVCEETHAQLDRLEALLGRTATHIDVHKHLHRKGPVLEGLMSAAAERKLPVRSIDEAMRAALVERGIRTNDHFLGDAGGPAYWTLSQLHATLAALPAEGLIELMCHPGYAPEQVKSGYSVQRETELATFVSAEAHAAVAALPMGIFDPR